MIRRRDFITMAVSAPRAGATGWMITGLRVPGPKAIGLPHIRSIQTNSGPPQLQSALLTQPDHGRNSKQLRSPDVRDMARFANKTVE